uniref:Reverse transcriptase domain-containing protein n=1 Tax=Tanacetum cinerariifolium TaxID=118510 RepID=A0A6L2JXJ6_TANCI|nr:reverse transcriptase domain-containing protein [Tanacetum cinerariifolium]
MMASFFQMNTASSLGSGSLHGNTIANPKGELKAITTRSGLVVDGPFVSMPPSFINLEEDERAEETLTDPKLVEYTIKVPPPLVQKAKPLLLRNYVMLKALLSNKEKLLELANTPLNENCSAVIIKKLPEKLGDPRKFLIPYGFNEFKCKALANLGASINLMPLSVWKKIGLPELISTRITLELANRAIYTSAGIARDVFVSVGKFTFLADFVIVNYESDPRVPLILGRPFLRIARALIDVHGEEMILRDGDERLTLNMRHDTSSYSNQPHKESVNMIDIYNDSYEDYLEDLFTTDHLSGNPTFSSHTDLTSPEVDALPSTNNEDKVFNPGILIHENLFEVTIRVTPDKNVKKISISNASLILEDFNPPIYELPFHKEVPGSKTLLSFSSENKEKVFNLGILTSKGVNTSLLLELSHRDLKLSKSLKILKA